MSADNGVYVMEFTDGYRVSYAFAIDNITYDPDYHGFSKEYLQKYFGHSNIYQSREEASTYAFNLLKELINDGAIVEYGVSYIHVDEVFDFPT